MLVNEKVEWPTRGSTRFARTITCRSGEYHVSLVDTIGCELPIAPAGTVCVTLFPWAVTPAMVWVPKSVVVVFAASLGPCGAPGGRLSVAGLLGIARRVATFVLA